MQPEKESLTWHKFVNANNLEYLKTLPDNYADSFVTDSPYGLGAEPDPITVLSDWITKGYHEIKSSSGGFMGLQWDSFVPQPLFWKEVYRVLKPGGYLLSFFGTRTYDWGVMAIRLAGFEIRDKIDWIYGSGFPKSMDISKAIDKEAGVEREISHKRKHPTLKDTSKIEESANASHGQNLWSREWNITKPATEQSKKWSGWGTALKPAVEPIVVARKPISEKTIAQNVLKWGTGGINIDECRIETDEIITNHSRGEESSIIKGKYADSKKQETHQTNGQKLGRFPSNLILDEEAGKLLDEQSGYLISGKPSGVRNIGKKNVYGEFGAGIEVTGYGDDGGASRFFYCAKTSTYERNKGVEHLDLKKCNEHSRFDQCENCGGYILQGEDRPSRCTCDNPKRAAADLKGNTHPTVKPISLMRYLVRLVTPKYGICIDPFVGSGTTAIACKLEFINSIGIDEDADWITISELRTKAWNPEKYVPQTLF